MNTTDIARLRLCNQQIVSTRLNKPEEVAAWLGGMQGQIFHEKSMIFLKKEQKNSILSSKKQIKD